MHARVVQFKSVLIEREVLYTVYIYSLKSSTSVVLIFNSNCLQK